MTNSVWVGEWRPHRPRGPICAHFKSPGPKYMLPGSTGYNTHDARKYRNPSYSFGTRHAKFTSDCSPGPGYLVPARITRTGMDGTPKYSLYSRRSGIEPYRNPGPGTYSPEKSGRSAYFSAPSYSLSNRTKPFKTDNSPGPAAYMLPKVLGPFSVGKTSLPSYTMVSRRSYGSFHDDLQRVTVHDAKLDVETLLYWLKHLSGPGRYGFPPILTASPPAYTMVGKKYVGSFSEDLSMTPGPGTYRIVPPSVFKDKSPHYSMTGRNVLPSDNTQKPGPGAHSPERMMNVRKSAPVYSFGIRHSEYIAPLIVDPGH